MTSETKKHIDAARQILVGVVPNPTSQIDQITNALIYKFMDDMDQAAINQGGEPSFFVGDLKRYSWTKLMDARIGNQERMNIYSEALVKFSESKQLPTLFREIFKSALLPYRNPEVLGLFLKEVAYFDYSHSEELGNAYEYLLSIMGSQGDAGQFRTPRHIIDFMVDVVSPTVEDKVLDPACGTGGFLVSAYKHILEQHDGRDSDGKKNNNEKPLTPDQRKKLAENFEGYDIDPGMVRIAQVNMYLHQFKNPKIYNYDTLTMEERWNDKFSVILANPPFMSPKGGVSTHSKFSIQSTRSEVLFVDYIMNHLRPNGRAGIIVPEGIIFQKGKAYSSLRKLLLDKGIWAVISLPVGVFNPYTKTTQTSILLIDKEIQIKNDGVLFIKIKNDGFDLGAERFPIAENDLPEAVKFIDSYRSGLKQKTYLNNIKISLKDLIERPEVNFAVFNEVMDENNSNYENIKIGQILKQQKMMEFVIGIKKYKQITVKMNGKGVILRKEIQGSNIKTKTQFIASAGDFIISKIDARNGAFGIVPLELNGAIVTSDFPLFKVDQQVMLPDFLNIVIQSPQFIKICQLTSVGTSNRRRVNLNRFLDSKIPLPTLKEQKVFLSEIMKINSEIYNLENKIEVLRKNVNNKIENIWVA